MHGNNNGFEQINYLTNKSNFVTDAKVVSCSRIPYEGNLNLFYRVTQNKADICICIQDWLNKTERGSCFVSFRME